MAGSYMDAPGMRLAYDRDGTLGVVATAAGVLTQLTSTQLVNLNSEAESGFVTTASFTRIALIFPIPLDLKALFWASVTSDGQTWAIETSKDTTTGLDGNWTTHIAAQDFTAQSVKPNYRIASKLLYPTDAAAALGVRGLRLRGVTSTTNPKALHVYADPSASATTDRLALWQPSTDVKITPQFFDWGNTPRSTSADKTFRIKNLSSTLTANNINIYIEALLPGTPSVNGMHTLSDNGGATFLNSLTIPSLAPGAISGVLTLRRTIPANAQVSVWSARVAADVTSWT